MSPVLVRRRIYYLVNCEMHLCQFCPLFGLRLTTEVGVWGPDILSSDHVMLVPLLTLKSRPVCRGLRGSDVLDILRLSILHWLYYVETYGNHIMPDVTLRNTMFIAEDLRGGLCLQVVYLLLRRIWYNYSMETTHLPLVSRFRILVTFAEVKMACSVKHRPHKFFFSWLHPFSLQIRFTTNVIC